MIGLVLVSHSAKLAEGVRDLAQQMTQGRVPIAVAGGLDDAQHPIGTDPMKVCAAVEAVYSPDGVVVLMDLGSALMSAETALELLDPAWLPHIHLCDAPLVEGAVAAAVQAGIGSSIEVVMGEARAALSGKQGHLAPLPPALPNPAPQDGLRLHIVVPNPLGIHARPAARLVGLAGEFAATITVQKGERRADARSLSQLALLDARFGDEIVFMADGADADAALRAIRALADAQFGDQDGAHAAPPPIGVNDDARMPAGALRGIPAAGGAAVGRIVRLDARPPTIEHKTISDLGAEIARLERAIDAAGEELARLIPEAAARLGANEAAIFEAHRHILQDSDLVGAARARIEAERQNAEAAWWAAVEALAAAYRGAESALLQARAADLLDVGGRVLRQLAPQAQETLDLPSGSILAAADLAPSQTARLNPDQIAGIVTQFGGATSHTAIIARSLGIPAVVGVGDGFAALRDGDRALLDGDGGWLQPNPDDAQAAAFAARIAAWRAQQAAWRTASHAPAITPDGRRIEAAANIGTPAEAAGAFAAGAEGVGLFRTELLFMSRTSAPDEDEQTAAYAAAADAVGGAPLIVRTLDVGGDKPLAYMPLPPEDNPFLGYRGIRNWLDNPDVAAAQLRAICRASAGRAVKVMFPMVGALDELRRARALLHAVWAQLDAAGVPYNPAMEVGIMIEVPSAVLTADQFAPEVDFFSIGTNDLTQYLMAADRGNRAVSALVSPYQPAVLRAIKAVVDAAHAHGKWVGICGEMAGNPRLTALLLGLGVDELSMSAPSLPEVKAIIRRTRYADAQALAAHALTLARAEEVAAWLMERENG